MKYVSFNTPGIETKLGHRIIRKDLVKKPNKMN